MFLSALSSLPELHLNDCRLLETWTDKEACLLQLVSALKSLSSLHTLSLAQNRLGKLFLVTNPGSKLWLTHKILLTQLKASVAEKNNIECF